MTGPSRLRCQIVVEFDSSAFQGEWTIQAAIDRVKREGVESVRSKLANTGIRVIGEPVPLAMYFELDGAK